MNLEVNQAGGMDCLGQMWTWVSGEAESSPITIIGTWSDVVSIHADRATVKIHADRQRIEVRG